MLEKALTFTVNHNQSLAIEHGTSKPSTIGVLLIVGGPQYRVGSHRQFVQLARSLAQLGIPVLRFDYTGMGDSAGDKKSFEQICPDICAAIDCFIASQPQLEKIVLWGLCDAASAAMIYAHQDSRVAGMVLLNPWLRNEQAKSKTMIKYYYLQRLLSKGFWSKLLSGKLNIAKSVGDASSVVKNTLSKEQQTIDSYQQRMRKGITAFNGKICLILSGNDITAREFAEQVINNKQWPTINSPQTQVFRLPQADHTFSNRANKQQVETITAEFINQLIKY